MLVEDKCRLCFDTLRRAGAVVIRLTQKCERFRFGPELWLAPYECRHWSSTLLAGSLLLLSYRGQAQEQERDGAIISARAGVSLDAKVSRPVPMLGAGHATLLELIAIDTQGDRLHHSFGVGAGGVVSTAAAAGIRAKSSRAARFGMDWHLAGGESGFDGLLHIDFGHGARWPAQGHGVVVRGGADLKFAGNHQYYFSAFDAPNVDAGYQYVGYGQLVELSFRTSLLWDGRFRFENDPSKNLPTTIGWGPLFELGVSPIWVSLQLLRGAGLTQASADLCSRPSGAWSLCMKLGEISDGWPMTEATHRLTTAMLGIGWAPTGN
jgi:hypothetical protein